MRTMRLKMLAEVNPPSPVFDLIPDDAEVAFVPMEGVGFDTLKPDLRPKRDVLVGYTRFEDGDVLLPKIAPTFAHGRVVIAKNLPSGVGVGTTELHVLRPHSIDARWLRYIMISEPFLQEGQSSYYGVAGQKRISLDWLVNYRSPLPNIEEQRRIADYLDAQCARIDALIREQTDTIELLWERRHAAVFDATTGRTLAGPRRSGVPWVESIPGTWEAVKLTSVARLGSGHTPARNRPELWEECTIPWITTGEVWQIRSDLQEVLIETREKISLAGVAESAATLRPAGTVVLCRTAASAGYSAIMGTDMATSQDFATWTCGPALAPRFLLYCLRAMRRDLLQRLAVGSTHRTIYMPEIKSLVIPLPERDEQAQIVARLSDDLDTLDCMRSELVRQIELLREHRQALITAAVTGDFDVSSAA